MKSKNVYLVLLLIHMGLGLLLYLFKFFGFFVSISLFISGLVIINNTKDKNFQALNLAGYTVGIEILLRMTGTNIFNEYGKYVVMIFLFLGIVHRGFSNKALFYVLFMLLFIPGIYVGVENLSLDANIRKAIAFNVTGPITLAVSAIYCMDKVITYDQIKHLLIAIGLPIVSILTYVFIHTPSVKDVVTGTQSNFETSGGFGPNQVSTILGLGMFVFFSLFLLYSRNNKRVMLINLIITVAMAYRAIVTFSRGGVFTAIVCIISLLFFLYITSNQQIRSSLRKVILFSLLGGGGIWIYSNIETGGMIQNRYENKDAAGRLKEDRLGGREKVNETELQMFLDNPIWGVGIGKNKEYREEMTGIKIASHNEITRMLADQGVFGLIGLLILFFVPFFHFFSNRNHIFLFSFLLFWLLTINHAAMRIAAPAFVYALTLLKVRFNENSVSRESTI